ncbi:MAG: hypothetical protein QOE45_1457 [Frankiaceae bacterium]|jgi:hypothetical protein|nr:hypothetical protein [Frankiaceae bacterium]
MFRRRPYLAALLVLALLLAVALRVLAARSPAPGLTLARPAPGVAQLPATPAPPAPSQPSPARPPLAASPPLPLPDAAAVRAALATLDRARGVAYADPPGADPGAWATPSCACRGEDVRRLRSLARSGLALRGQAVTVVSVTVLDARAGPAGSVRVDAAVVDRVGAYTAVDRTGRAVRRWPATGPRRWRLTLVLAAERWRYTAVARAP